MPNWLKVILWVAVAIVILMVLKINVNVGAGGLHVTQGLVH